MGAGVIARLTQAGHTVLVSGHNAEKAAATAEEASAGQQGSAKAVDENVALEAGIVVLALWYPATVDFATENADKLAGKIVIDIAIPLDSTYTRLTTPPDTSAAEELSKAIPQSFVVKAMNTIPAGTLKVGEIGGIDVDAFVASDSQEATDTVIELLNGSGLRALDAGKLDNARLLERLTAFGIELGQRHGVGFDFGWKFLPAGDLFTEGD
jgi:NADPH-dependent F420 reductase